MVADHPVGASFSIVQTAVSPKSHVPTCWLKGCCEYWQDKWTAYLYEEEKMFTWCNCHPTKTKTRICTKTICSKVDACGIGVRGYDWWKKVIGLGRVYGRVTAAVVHQDHSVSIGDPHVVILTRRLPLNSKVGELQSQHLTTFYLDRLGLLQVVRVVAATLVIRGGNNTCDSYYKKTGLNIMLVSSKLT